MPNQLKLIVIGADLAMAFGLAFYVAPNLLPVFLFLGGIEALRYTLGKPN